MVLRTSFAIVLSVLTALVAPAGALASDISVQPIQIHLGAHSPSTVLTIANGGREPVRLQISGTAWGESPTGAILSPATSDLVFFPTLLTLGPGEQRSLRVGVSVPPGTTEQTYRIYVEELPSLASQLLARAGASVYIRTKMGIPVYLDPLEQHAHAQIVQTHVAHGVLGFGLLADGTLHVVVPSIHLTALSANGTRLYDEVVPHSYVLAGVTRRYSVRLKNCTNISSLRVNAQTDAGLFTSTLPLDKSECAR